MSYQTVKTGGVDIWTDLLIACLVVFVVLAPAFFFKAPADPETVQNSPPKRTSVYRHKDNEMPVKRRRADIQQRLSGSRVSEVVPKHSTSNGTASKKVF
ncbi:hypothetical protein P3T76_002026 [Phytophthora citrophthora]|uniref:Uncharacterized protein n=1 Tax=Phytophthora citrophthora TaxID=4793 RepID=A0AAD9GYL6_9STRA|nr:hypothetical protein P3T76_002026 [Phytophthora citrophthora]